jgi:hypothetical protein
MFRHLVPALAGFVLGAAAMFFLGSESAPVLVESASQVSPIRAENVPPTALPSAPAALSRAAGDQDREITQLNAAIIQLKREVAEKEAQLALIESMGKGLFEHFTTQIEDDTKQGVQRSGFESLEDTARFMGALSRRSFALRKRFPTPPAPDTHGREEYDRLMAEIMRDSALVLQDTRMLSAFTNGDVKNIAVTKALSTSAALDLNPTQTTALQTIFESTYGEGFAQKLDQKNKPEKDVEAWQKSRDDLTRRAADRVRGILTPAQRADFDAMGGAGSFWSLSIGGL